MFVYIVISYEEYDSFWSTPEAALKRLQEVKLDEHEKNIHWQCQIQKIDANEGFVGVFNSVKDAAELIVAYERRKNE